MIEMVQVEKQSYACPPNECDTFEFMAKKLGMKVLHPGGLDATQELAQRCKLSRDMTILDVGCGRGSSTVFLAKKYGCRVVGVDIDSNLLRKAQKTAMHSGVLDRVAFRQVDIHDLPFEDEAFDMAIAQAVLIFTEKPKVLIQMSAEPREKAVGDSQR